MADAGPRDVGEDESMLDSRAEVRSPTRRPAVLAAGDAAMLVLWSVLGLMSHQEGVTLSGLARNSGFVLAGWFAVAALLGTYRRPGWRTFLAAWAAGVSLGVVVRWVALRRPLVADEFVFWAVTLVVTLALLLAWRLAERVAPWAIARLRRPAPASGPGAASARRSRPAR
jgi:hypothetical protein